MKFPWAMLAAILGASAWTGTLVHPPQLKSDWKESPKCPHLRRARDELLLAYAFLQEDAQFSRRITAAAISRLPKEEPAHCAGPRRELEARFTQP